MGVAMFADEARIIMLMLLWVAVLSCSFSAQRLLLYWALHGWTSTKLIMWCFQFNTYKMIRRDQNKGVLVQQAKEESSIHKTMVASLSTINKRKHELEVSTYSKGFTEGRIQRKQTRDAVCSDGKIILSVSEEKRHKTETNGKLDNRRTCRAHTEEVVYYCTTNHNAGYSYN